LELYISDNSSGVIGSFFTVGVANFRFAPSKTFFCVAKDMQYCIFDHLKGGIN
jgi:hypothetical protein